MEDTHISEFESNPNQVGAYFFYWPKFYTCAIKTRRIIIWTGTINFFARFKSMSPAKVASTFLKISEIQRFHGLVFRFKGFEAISQRFELYNFWMNIKVSWVSGSVFQNAGQYYANLRHGTKTVERVEASRTFRQN